MKEIDYIFLTLPFKSSRQWTVFKTTIKRIAICHCEKQLVRITLINLSTFTDGSNSTNLLYSNCPLTEA